MTTAQDLANIAVSNFASAVQTAVATGHKQSTGFSTMEYSFEDGSILRLRAGRVQSPVAQRVVFRDVCGDIDVKAVA
jgi:hypothetical protein